MKTGGKNVQSVLDPYSALSYRIITYHRTVCRKSDGKAPVMLEINMHNKRVRINTEVTIPPEAWDKDRLQLKKSYPEAKTLNLIE